MILSLYASGKGIPSFPTRRSSDLWVPLALLWFGQSEGAMLFVVVMGTMWSVAIATDTGARTIPPRSEEHTSELQSRLQRVCRLLLEKKKNPLSALIDNNVPE